ncbi:MAG: hypothetical protein Q8Q60_01525 [Candidatus Chromulinivorax sp.]|nr:hypothetical protein [Candidatus Chromulinivorax sp.]
MKNLVVSFAIMILLSGSYIFCSEKDIIGDWVSISTHAGYEMYTKWVLQPDGTLRKMTGMRSEGEVDITQLAPVIRSEDSLDFYDDQHRRTCILDPEISEETLERVKSMKLHAPTSQAEHLAQKLAHQKAVAELHSSYSRSISTRGDDASYAKSSEIKKSYDRDSDDDSGYQGGDESNNDIVEV